MCSPLWIPIDRCTDGTGFYAANIVPDVDGGPQGNGEYETINPWLAVLIYEDWYQDMIRDKWTSAYDSDVFENAYLMMKADEEQYRDAFTRNYERWNNIVNNYSFVSELSERAAACKTHSEATDYLLEWLQSRVEFLNAQWYR